MCHTVDFYEPPLPRNPIYFILAVIIAVLVAITISLSVAHAETLQASWYSIESLKKEGTYAYSKGQMANGKYFRDDNFTCATRLFPLGSIIRVTNRANNKSITVIVTDRISKRFAKTRIDLSRAAFERISVLAKGVIKVEIKILN